MTSQTYSRSRQPSDLTLKVEALLLRYPDIREDELSILIDSVPHLPVLDAGLMTADDRLARKLHQFHCDHGHRLKMTLSSKVAFLALPSMLALALVFWGVQQMMAG